MKTLDYSIYMHVKHVFKANSCQNHRTLFAWDCLNLYLPRFFSYQEEHFLCTLKFVKLKLQGCRNDFSQASLSTSFFLSFDQFKLVALLTNHSRPWGFPGFSMLASLRFKRQSVVAGSFPFQFTQYISNSWLELLLCT